MGEGAGWGRSSAALSFAQPDAAVLQVGPAAGRFMPEPADELMVSLASPGNKC